jgi:streptogramin lyase
MSRLNRSGYVSLRFVKNLVPFSCVALIGFALPAGSSAQASFQGVNSTLATVTNSAGEVSLTSVAVDSGGNYYAIEQLFDFDDMSQTYSVLKFAAQAGGGYAQSTLASSANDTFSGVAADSAGNVYYTDQTASAIIKLTPSGSSYTASTLPIAANQPGPIAVDANFNLYVGENGAGEVDKETYSAGVYTPVKVVGGGIYASSVAVDGGGNVYVTQGNIAQFLVFTNNGNGAYTQITVPVTGPLPYVYVISAVPDSAGNVYVSDENSASIDKFVPSGGSYTETSLAGGMYGAYLAMDSHGNLAVATQNYIEQIGLNYANFGGQPVAAAAGTSTDTLALNFTIASGQTVGSVSVLTTGIAGKDFTDAGSSTCTAQTYSSATNCVVNVNFTPLVPGLRRGAVVIADGSGAPLATAPVYGAGNGPQAVFPPQPSTLFSPKFFSAPALAVDAAGNVYASATEAGIDHVGLAKIAPNGSQTVLTQDDVGAVAIDGAGNLYYGDLDNNTFLLLTPNGSSSALPYSGSGTTSLTFDGTGNVYYSLATQVFSLTPAGVQTLLFTVPNSGSISSIAVDASGNLYVADSINNSVYKVNPQGVSSTLVSGLNGVRGIAVDPAGNVYVAEFNNGHVDEVSPAGVVTPLTIAGNAPYAVALDQTGNVYFSDWLTNSIYEIVRTTLPSLSFASTLQGSESIDSPQVTGLQNIGNAAINFSKIAYPSDFPEDNSGATDCSVSTPLVPGAACTFTVDFRPVAALSYPNTALLGESVGFSTNILSNPTQSFAVSGTETAPELTVATPMISAPSGTYNNSLTITITETTPGATVYYTANGAAPTTASAVYTGPITVGNSTTIQAIAIAPNYFNSSIGSAGYTLAALPPSMSLAAGAYTGTQTVTISSASTSALIFYTTNGSVPNANAARYTGPITVSASETLKAIAIATGYTPSPVVSATYYITAPPSLPIFTPAGGTYNNPQSITLSDTGTGATFYYTTDGSTPTAASPKYTGPIAMWNGLTLKAIASVPGYGITGVGTATYSLTAGTPVATAPAGSYLGPQTVTLSSVSTAAMIFYSTNGTIPGSSSPRYTGPISVSSSETLTFVAMATGYSPSPVVSAIYYIAPPPAPPTFALAGGVFNNPQTVSIAESVSGATVYYTLNGTTPTASSMKYTGPFTLGSSATVNAVAISPGYSPSSIGSATYTLVAATPSVSLPSGSYTGPQTVTVTTASAAAHIFYSTNGKTPTASCTLYTGPITVSSSETLTFAAIATGYTASTPVAVTYTIH